MQTRSLLVQHSSGVHEEECAGPALLELLPERSTPEFLKRKSWSLDRARWSSALERLLGKAWGALESLWESLWAGIVADGGVDLTERPRGQTSQLEADSRRGGRVPCEGGEVPVEVESLWGL